MMKYLFEATFESGFVVRQNLTDQSAFDPKRNQFYDILNGLWEPQHGRMVRWSCIGHDERFDIDWRKVPPNARPILFRDYERKLVMVGEAVIADEVFDVSTGFGYQWTDTDGDNHEVIRRLK